MHATLLLRRTRAGLHAHGTLIPELRRVLHGLGTHVLEALLHTVGEIRTIFITGPLSFTVPLTPWATLRWPLSLR